MVLLQHLVEVHLIEDRGERSKGHEVRKDLEGYLIESLLQP